MECKIEFEPDSASPLDILISLRSFLKSLKSEKRIRAYALSLPDPADSIVVQNNTVFEAEGDLIEPPPPARV